VYVLISEVYEHQMIIGSATYDVEAVRNHRFCEGACIGNHLFSVGFKFRIDGFSERNGFSSDHMFEWPALNSGEISTVEHGTHHFGFAFWRFVSVGVLEIFTHHNQSATWTAQSFVGGGGYNVAVFKW